MSIISWTSPRPSWTILPASSVTSRASGSLAARNSSPSSRTSSPRRGAGTLRHAGRPLRALAGRCDVRRDRRSATLPISLPSIGERLSRSPPHRRPQAASSSWRRFLGGRHRNNLPCFGHGGDAGVDRLVALGEAQPDRGGAADPASANGDSGTTATPACSTAGLAKALVVERQCPTPRGRRTGNRSRRCRAPQSRPRCRPSRHPVARPGEPLAHRLRSSHRPRSSPKATAACRLGAEAKVRNWCARAASVAISGAATSQPTFQPVSEKILPAEPHLDRPLGHAGQRGERRETSGRRAGYAPTPRR